MVTGERTELPIRVDETPGGLVLRGLCGAEAAVMRMDGELFGGLGGDGSPAALARMAVHVKGCRECQYRQLETQTGEVS